MTNVIEVIFRGVDHISGQTERINTSLVSIERTALRAGIALAGAFAVSGVARGVRAFAHAADTMTLVGNRLRLVTESVDELNDVQSKLFELAQDTRSAFAPTVDLYARMVRSTRDLNIADSQLLDLTRAVNQSIQISGATAAESSAGVIQFAQALASNRLGGDELRSVLEQMPRLARALADGLGVTIGQLRALAKEGKLTTEAIVGALQSQAPKIAEEFERINPTIASAFTTLHNSVLEIVDDINDATGVSDALADSIIGVADAVTSLSNIIDPADVTRAEAITNELDELRNPSLFDSLKNGLRGIGEVVDAIRNPSSAHLAAMTLGMGKIDKLEAELASIEDRANRMRGLGNIVVPDMDDSVLTEAFDKWEKENKKRIDRLADHFVTKFATAQQAMQQELDDFDVVVKVKPELFSQEDIERIRNAIRMEGLDDIVHEDSMQRRLDNLLSHTDEWADRMKSIADEAARSMQRAFSDFFFDPFNDGLEGMVAGFLNAVRRMLADEAAIRFFNLLSGNSSSSGGGLFGSIIKGIGGLFGGGNPFSTAAPGGGPPRAHGGFTIPGLLHPVNEREPEFLLTRGRSEVVPLSKLAANGAGGGSRVFSPTTTFQLMTAPLSRDQLEEFSQSREDQMFAKFKRMLRDDGID